VQESVSGQIATIDCSGFYSFTVTITTTTNVRVVANFAGQPQQTQVVKLDPGGSATADFNFTSASGFNPCTIGLSPSGPVAALANAPTEGGRGTLTGMAACTPPARAPRTGAGGGRPVPVPPLILLGLIGTLAAGWSLARRQRSERRRPR
jgi:hypothetical protein